MSGDNLMLVLAISGCHDNHQHQVGGSLGTVLSLCQETKSFGIEWTGWRQFYQGGAGWLCWRSFTPPDPCWLKGDEVATEWSKLVPTSTTIIQPLRPPPSLGWVTSLSIKCCKICSSETGWPDRTVSVFWLWWLEWLDTYLASHRLLFTNSNLPGRTAATGQGLFLH